MTIANETAATAYRVLNKFTCEMEPSGPWSWQCVVQNGARLPLAASFDEGFLQLACRPESIGETTLALEDAMLCNNSLAGGVKLALHPSGSGLHLRTDIVVLDERQLQDRLEWALEGFHEGTRLLKSPDLRNNLQDSQTDPVSNVALAELLQEASWPCVERGPNNFSADLDANAAPPASIQMRGNSLVLSVELLRSNAQEDITRKALAVYILTAGSSLRMVRAHAQSADGQISYGFHVSLPSSPAAERTHAEQGTETGGILIGRLWRDSSAAEIFAEVTAQIPAVHASGTNVKLTFTPQVWTAADAALRLRRKGEIYLGYWHSHPVREWCKDKACTPEAQKTCSLGKDFFSADDEAVMRAAFPRAYSIAIVANDTAFTDLTFSMFGNRKGITQPRGFYVLEEKTNAEK